MRRTTRQNIRRGLRRGVTVRMGTERDLPTFYQLLLASSHRQGFTAYAEEYFSALWRVLHPYGYAQLFLAECGGGTISALLAIAFGDTVCTNCLGWCGSQGSWRPNDVLFWRTIEWAQSEGYRYCDLEGIDADAGRLLVQGESLPDSLRKTSTFFKLGFGGRVTLLPEPYDCIYNPVLRWAYRRIPSKFVGTAMVQGALAELARKSLA